MINLADSTTNKLCNRLVIVDGIPGCGKTMLSSIISSLKDVEMLKYSYETEIYCLLNDFNLISEGTATQLIKNQLDLSLYNTMMGREMNFKYTDISSVFQNPHKIKNLNRLFGKGDEFIPAKIRNENPILHITTHGITGISNPIVNLLNEGMLFINLRRHPIYLLRQNIWNMTNLINDQRSFWLYYKYKELTVPTFYFGNEELFIKSNPKEKAIYFIEWYFNKQKFNKNIKNSKYYYELSFESLVTEPYSHLNSICNSLNSKTTYLTPKFLKKENIPRKIITDSRSRDIYKRVGWVKSSKTNFIDEFQEIKNWAFEGINKNAQNTLEKLCFEFESNIV